MTMDVKASQVAASTAAKSSANVGAVAATGGQECAGCGKHITDRYIYIYINNPTILLLYTRYQFKVFFFFFMSNTDTSNFLLLQTRLKRSLKSITCFSG